MTEIGITGGIGSGKSHIAFFFGTLGVPIYDADSRSKQLLMSSDAVRHNVLEYFGSQAILDGQINRAYLAKAIFGSEDKRAVLNAWLHPLVAADYQTWLLQHTGAAYILKESALLYETGIYHSLDKVIVVTASHAVYAHRVML